MGWDWLYLKDSLQYTLASLILVTFVQTIFDSIRFLTVFYLTRFLVLSCSANVPGISLCPHSCKLYLYPYDCVIVGCIPGFVWFCLFFDTQFLRCFYLKSDGFIPSVVGFITVYPHYEWICPNFIQ